MNTIIAGVITYNRLNLLKEVVQALKSQTLPLHEIVIVDNMSTDGTAEWLAGQQHITVITQPNNGISGGVCTALKAARKRNADWVWIMDDDSIPNRDALQILVEKLPEIPEKVGFIGPKCLWTDGNVHFMNIPSMKSYVHQTPFNKYDHKGVIVTENGSFASLLINMEAVNDVGLPYKEFFIWGDDQEYTRRIVDGGYLGLYCGDSVAIHKTPINYEANVFKDNVKNIWKHKYGFRNEFFMVKKRRGFIVFSFWLFAKVGYTTLKIFKLRTDNRLKFTGALFQSAWQSILFNPKIDRL